MFQSIPVLTLLVGLNEEVRDGRVICGHTDTQSITSLLGVTYYKCLQERDGDGSAMYTS